MSDLTMFVMARVAEDEMMARAWVDGFEPFGPDTDYLWYFCPARVLAECEAKRRIVEWMSNWQNDVALEGTLLLAAVYADHPDYRPEWRP